MRFAGDSPDEGGPYEMQRMGSRSFFAEYVAIRRFRFRTPETIAFGHDRNLLLKRYDHCASRRGEDTLLGGIILRQHRFSIMAKRMVSGVRNPKAPGLPIFSE